MAALAYRGELAVPCPPGGAVEGSLELEGWREEMRLPPAATTLELRNLLLDRLDLMFLEGLPHGDEPAVLLHVPWFPLILVPKR